MFDCNVTGCGPDFRITLSWLPREGDEFDVRGLGAIYVCRAIVGLAARGYCTDMSNVKVTLECETKEGPAMIPTPPNAGVVTDGLRQHPVIKFLMGESDLDGKWFADIVHKGKPKYWWRSELEAALSAAPKRECTVVHSEDPSAPAYLALGAVKVTRERCG